MQDLDIEPLLDACVLSEEEGVAKPDPEIWRRAIINARLTLPPLLQQSIAPNIDQSLKGLSQSVLHVGDELDWCVPVL
jgi:FMN phosphatase YigB (HAD superfamily)